jgi:ATP-binding cassette subfamily F protein 3
LERKQVEQKAKNSTSTNSEQKIQWEERKELDRQIRKLESQVEKLEKEIAMLESTIAETDTKLSNPTAHGIDLSDKDFFKKYESHKTELMEKMEQWENLLAQVEELKTKRNNTN